MRALTIALAATVLILLLPFTSGLLGAAVVYVVVTPLLAGVTGLRHRRLAAFAMMFLLFFAFMLPGAWLLAELVAQVPDAVQSLQQSTAVQRAMALEIGSVELGTLLRQASSEIVAWSSRQTISVLGGMVSGTLNLSIALFGAYYLLTSGDDLWPQARARLPFSPATADGLRVRFHRVTEAMVLGVVVASVAQGTLVGLAFWLLGFQHALFWGAVTAIASILPIFGSGLVWLPATAVLIAQDRFGAAIALAVFGALVVSNVDNVLRLMVYRRVSQIHPMVTLVGAFAGVKAFGVAGLLLGPLVLSYALELARLDLAVAHVGDLPRKSPVLADTSATGRSVV